MRTEQDAVAPAGGDHGLELVDVAGRRIDVGQPVVVAPALPDVLDEHRVGQPIACREFDPAGRLLVVAAPLVQADLAQDIGDAGGGLKVGDRAIGPRRGKGTARRRQQGQRRVVVRVQRIHPGVRVHAQQIGKHIAGLQQGDAVGKVQADVPRRQLKAVGVQVELGWVLDHVAEAGIHASRPLRRRPDRQRRKPRFATQVAGGIGHRPSDAQRAVLGPHARLGPHRLIVFQQPMHHRADALGERFLQAFAHQPAAVRGQRRAVHLDREALEHQLALAVGKRQPGVRQTVRARHQRHAMPARVALQPPGPIAFPALMRFARPGQCRFAPRGTQCVRLRRRPLAAPDRRRGPECGIARRVMLGPRIGHQPQRDLPARPGRQVHARGLPLLRRRKTREQILPGIARTGLDPKLDAVTGTLAFRVVVTDRRGEFQRQRRHRRQGDSPLQQRVAPTRAVRRMDADRPPPLPTVDFRQSHRAAGDRVASQPAGGLGYERLAMNGDVGLEARGHVQPQRASPRRLPRLCRVVARFGFRHGLARHGQDQDRMGGRLRGAGPELGPRVDRIQSGIRVRGGHHVERHHLRAFRPERKGPCGLALGSPAVDAPHADRAGQRRVAGVGQRHRDSDGLVQRSDLARIGDTNREWSGGIRRRIEGPRGAVYCEQTGEHDKE